MKIEVLHCPNCNSTINDENMSFCPYCGSKLFVDDGTKRIEYNKTVTINKNTTIVNRDDTEIRKAELNDLRDQRRTKSSNRMIIFYILLLILCFAFVPLAQKYDNEQEEKKLREGIYIQTSAKEYEGKDYQIVVSELKGLGFTNIQTKDIPPVWYKKAGTVERISINGDAKFEKQTYFLKDVPILISYYAID